MDERDLRCDIVEVGRRLYARGLIGGNEGNISIRKGDTLFVTPAGVCKGFLAPEMIVRTDLEGRPQGGGRASTETLMHTAVYRRRADVRAVVHAHPPTATGFAAAGIPLDRPLIAEAVVTLGAVPIIPYGRPSTTELARSVGDAICAAHALLMANHGAITVGDGIYRAWERMETLEQLARVALVTRILGQDRLLSGAAVEGLLAARTEAGYPPPFCAPGLDADPGLPMGEPAAPSSDGTVTLTRRELVRLIEDAVERFSGAGRGRA
jgi:L-fuculose-phosphate aldolase